MGAYCLEAVMCGNVEPLVNNVIKVICVSSITKEQLA